MAKATATSKQVWLVQVQHEPGDIWETIGATTNGTTAARLLEQRVAKHTYFTGYIAFRVEQVYIWEMGNDHA